MSSLQHDDPTQRRSASDGPRNCTNHALEVVPETDTLTGRENGRFEANNLIFIWNVTSYADETNIMGDDGLVSNTAA